MISIVPKGVTKERIEIWHQDETRIGQQGSLTRIWAIKGTRPRVVRQQQFLSSYIYGAVCPKRGIGVGLILPYVNSECMNKHLEEISKAILPGNHGVVVVDQARWHMSQQLIIPKNITLLPLPPYSPELNPQENVWHFIKPKYLSNRVFKSLDDINNAAAEAWNKFVTNSKLIQSIASRKWAIV